MMSGALKGTHSLSNLRQLPTLSKMERIRDETP